LTAPSLDDQRLLATLERAFATHAGRDGVIDLRDLQKALGLRSEYLTRRVLKAFDRDENGVIDKNEFLAGVRTLVFGTDREKLWFAFRMHDHDGDGSLDRQEVLRMISICIAEADVAVRAAQPPEHLAHALFVAADKNKDGRISFDELEAIVRKRPELLRRMTRSEAIWIAPNEDLLAWIDEPRSRAPGRLARWLEDGPMPALILTMWVFAQLILVSGALILSHDANPLTRMGRALGACIDFDGALILVPVMRRQLGWLRSTWLGVLVPVDSANTFHRIVGHTLFALGAAHATAFVLAYASGHASSPLFRLAETQRGLTGTLLLAVFAVMWFFSLAFVRRSRHFELFYFTHLLYVAWFVLAIVHAPSFLVLAGIALLGFLVEQILRLRRRGVAASVVSSQALRSGVTRLELEKPQGFRSGPGDYVFLRVPAIARREWHPFTISSAPERDSLTFHIRSLGNWTRALRQRVEASPDAEGLVAYVDGPYTSPTAPIFESRFAVLIGAGIGVTPFASVLESLVLRANGSTSAPSKLKKVHFFWLNRDSYSFEWFAQLIEELERTDQSGLLDVHLCMTDVRTGATTLGLEMARDAMHASGRSDFITGLRTQTHLGPPDWESMLRTIARLHHPERVDVFFCGPRGLSAKLRPICERVGMTFREEKF
jgi:predicted ferric reductase/Ca2+-binding EF-hand superfamily protein